MQGQDTIQLWKGKNILVWIHAFDEHYVIGRSIRYIYIYDKINKIQKIKLIDSAVIKQ